MVDDFPLAFLDYGGLFFVISFVLAGIFISRCLLWRSGRAIVLSAWSFLAGFFFLTFFFDFGSQIYNSLPISDYHAPPSHVSRRLPPLPPQAPVVSVVGDRRVAPTRLEALCSVVRVRATFCLFFCRARRHRVLRRRISVWVAPVAARGRHPPPSGMSALPPLAAVCFGCFLPLCF
jgi:hypothetical protein